MTPTAGMYFKQVVAGGGAGHGFYRTLTIDHTQVGTADKTDFPILVSMTNASLKTVANGGKVQNASGFDIGFFSDVGITTRLKHEREKYVDTTGEVVFWVKVPTVSHTVDTVIYMAYGDTSITTDQSDAVNVWTNGFAHVWHAGDGSTLSTVDSVAGSFAITNATAGSGQIYGAGSFSTASQQYLLNTTTPITARPVFLSAWFKMSSTTFGASEDRIIASIGLAPTTPGGEQFFLSAFKSGSNVVLRMVEQHTGAAFSCEGTITPDLNWHHVLGGYYTGSPSVDIWLDGVALTLSPNGSPQTPSGLTHTQIAGIPFNTTSLYAPWQGQLDEVRWAHVDRSLDWALTEYNNQKTGSTLIATGVETAY